MSNRLAELPHVCGYASVLLAGAIFGFFYAWVCSTMWGLDAADPRVAISAMQAMNASVRNIVFFPAFFLTPVLLALAGLVMGYAGHHLAGRLFVAAAAVYLVGGLLLTMIVNVPLNAALAATAVPTTLEEAARVWDAYSGRWQAWNLVRTVLSGLSLLLATIGLAALGPHRPHRASQRGLGRELPHMQSFDESSR